MSFVISCSNAWPLKKVSLVLAKYWAWNLPFWVVRSFSILSYMVLIDWGNYSGRCSKSTPSGVFLPCTPELNSSHRVKIFVWRSRDRNFSMATEYTKTSPKQAFSRLRTTRIGLSFCKNFLPLVKSVTSHGIDFLKVYLGDELLVESLSTAVFEPRTSTGSRSLSSSTRIAPFSLQISSSKC